MDKSLHLVKVAKEAPHRNIVLVQADVVDHRSLKVSGGRCTRGVGSDFELESAAETVSQVTGGSLDVLIHNAVKKDYADGNLYRSLTE